MPTQNPYDRRQEQRNAKPAWNDGQMVAGQVGYLEQPSALDIEDLQAMAASARFRGERRATERLDRQHSEHLQAVQRRAWDEGHEAGEEAGRAQLLQAIDEQVGELARSGHQGGAQVLRAAGEDPRRVTKDQLERALDAAVDTLAVLISAHHEGFAAKAPF